MTSLNKKTLVIIPVAIFFSVVIIFDAPPSYAAEMPLSGELQMKGEFQHNDPPKPINTYKIPYQMSNGTLIDIEGKSNEGVYATANGENGLLKIKIPKNYPMSNVSYDAGGEPILLINDLEAELKYDTTDCFYEYHIPVEDSSTIKLLFTFIPEPHPFSAQDVPEFCLIQTMVDVSDDSVIASPYKQLKQGIESGDIRCKEGFALVIKSSNDLPACVTPDTKQKLIERGWAKI